MKQPPCCPVCQKSLSELAQQTSRFYPFCSEHCQMVDLGRWFTDYYVIEGKPVSDAKDVESEDM